MTNKCKITLPEKFDRELTYITTLLLSNIIPITIDYSDSNEIVIEFESKKIYINNSFFNSISGDYISKENIPIELKYFTNSLNQNSKIPMIYGEDVFKIDNDSIYCGLDIFASAFFMLTRWEEIVLPKDKFGRCDETKMFVVKHNIYHRAIVNEYIELLRSMLLRLNIDIPLQSRKFSVLITHDIDDLFRCDVKNFCKNIVGDILHRKSIKQVLLTIQRFIKFKLGKIKDPFDTFDEFMDLSDKYGYKNEFYFKASIPGEYDSTYDIFDPRVKIIMENIVKRGHKVGFHPSKNTFHNSKQFEVELKRLKSLGFDIDGGRQHFLLYDLPETIQTWESNGLTYDTGLGFYDRSGFRCGICYEYPFFDVIKRKQLDILIKPLIVIEGTLFHLNNLEQIEITVENCVKEVAKYSGIFVFLWHNDNFNRSDRSKFKPIYFNVVNNLNEYK